MKDPYRFLSWRRLCAGLSITLLPFSLEATDLVRRDADTLSTSEDYTLVVNPNGTVNEWERPAYAYGKSLKSAHVPGLSSIVAVAAGWTHRLALRADGTVWAWGKNEGGQLGLGDFTDREIPVQIPGLSNIKAIAAGSMHSLALTEGGSVYAWGNNTWGEIANGYATYVKGGQDGSDGWDGSASPRLIEGTQTIDAIAAGPEVTLLITNNGTVFGCGNNFSHQLGKDDRYWSTNLIQVPNLANIKKVAVGDYFCLALDDGGNVWSWGWNAAGSLGDGTPEYVLNGTWWEDVSRTEPQLNPLLSGIQNIAAGKCNGAAQASNGALYIWGMGKGMPSALAPYITDPVQAETRLIGYNEPVIVPGAEGALAIAAGHEQTYATFLSPGPTGDVRELTLGSAEDNFPPVMLKESVSIPLGRYESDKTFTVLGTNFYSTQKYVGAAIANQFTSIWGSYYTAIPTISAQMPPSVAVSSGSMSAVETTHPGFTGFLVNLSGSGELIKWAPATAGTPEIPPELIPGCTGVAAISNNIRLPFAFLTKEGKVWMLNENGLPTQQKKFARFDTIPVDTSSLSNIVQISTGSSYGIALDRNGKLFGWGNNVNKQIMPSSVSFYYTPVEITGITNVRSIYCGGTLSYAIKNDGIVCAWGYGNPGDGSLLNKQGPRNISPMLDGVVSLSISPSTSLAITANGKVLSWGSNNNTGAQGSGSTVARLTAGPVAGMSNIVEVLTNGSVSFFRQENGDVYACGTNTGGALGVGVTGGSFLAPVKISY